MPFLFLGIPLYTQRLKWVGGAVLFFISVFFQDAIPPVQSPKTVSVTAGLIHGMGQRKSFFLGYEHVVADLFWLKAVQILGNKKITKEQYLELHDTLDLVTTLDPKFDRAYKFGGLVLSSMGGMPEKGRALLYKGHNALPNDGMILFYIAFHDFFYFENYLSAAENMEKAALRPDAPPIAASLGPALYIEAGRPFLAIAMLTQMIQITEDEQLKETFRKRIQDIQEGKAKGINRPEKAR